MGEREGWGGGGGEDREGKGEDREGTERRG